MRPNRIALGFGEAALFVNDVEQCLVDLANVVEERDALDVPLLCRVEVRCVGEN